MYLLATYAQDSELQAITAPSLISTLYKSLAYAKSTQTLLVVSWQRLLSVEIPKAPALRFSCHSNYTYLAMIVQHQYFTLTGVHTIKVFPDVLRTLA
jgi:hypothetical protein